MKKRAIYFLILLALQTFLASAQGLDRPECGLLEFRGDFNGDGKIDISDSIKLLRYLFAGEELKCTQSDINSDGKVDLSDSIYMLNFLFKGGLPPEKIDHDYIDDVISLQLNIKNQNIKINEFGEIEANTPLSFIVLDYFGDDDLMECNADITSVDAGNEPIGDKRIIFQSQWTKDSEFKGRNLLSEFIEIPLESVPNERSLINIVCSTKESSSRIEFILVERTSENLKYKLNAKEENFISLGDDDPDVPVSTGPKACCQIICTDKDGNDQETCEQTTAQDCQSNSVDWNGKYTYESPAKLCEHYFSGSGFKSLSFDKDKACNKEVSPSKCGEKCEVTKMTILKGGDEMPDEIKMNVDDTFAKQTVGGQYDLGYVEGWIELIGKDPSGKKVEFPSVNYRLGYRFVPFGTVKGDANTCFSGQTIKVTRIKNGDGTNFYISKKVPDLIFKEDDIINRYKLSELNFGKYNSVREIYEKAVTVSDTTEDNMKDRLCIVGGKFVCGDDYNKPPQAIKLNLNDGGKILWYDSPGLFPSQDKIEISKDFPLNPKKPWDGNTGSIKGSFFSEQKYDIISIIEDSTESHRFICFLNYIDIFNLGDGATANMKGKLNEGVLKCHCEEQVRNAGKWAVKVVDGKIQNELPCGEEGLS